MVAISDKRGTAYLFANLHPEDRYAFIAKKANNGGGDHSPQIADTLRVKEAVNGFVTGNNGTGEDGEHHNHPRQILYTTITVAESLTRFPAR